MLLKTCTYNRNACNILWAMGHLQELVISIREVENTKFNNEGRQTLNDKETRRGYQEWTNKRHGQQLTQDTENKQNRKHIYSNTKNY